MHTVAVMARVVRRPANIRTVMWLVPRIAKAVPYLGYIFVAGDKPA